MNSWGHRKVLLKAQKFVEKKKIWDPWRSALFSTIGIFWVGPYVRFALNKINSLTKLWTVKARIIPRTLVNPIFCFIYTRNYPENRFFSTRHFLCR